MNRSQRTYLVALLGVFLAIAGAPALLAQVDAPPVVRWQLGGSAAHLYAIVGASDDGHALSLTQTGTVVAGSNEYGAAGTMVNAERYRGRRVRVHALIRTDSATTGGSMWVRIDGASEMLSIENNMSRRLTGTTGWSEQITTLDVPASADHIVYGLLLGGSGTLHAREVSIEAVAPGAHPLIAWELTGMAHESYAIAGVADDGHALSLTRIAPVTDGPNQFGATAAVVNAEPYRGRRVRVRTLIRTDSASAGGSMWVRIDGASGMLTLENNMSRSLSGTTGWTEQVTTLDVPVSATRIIYGLLLSGGGTLHAKDVSIENVPPGAPGTP